MSRALPAYALPLLGAESTAWLAYREAVTREIDHRLSNRLGGQADVSGDPKVRELGARWRAARDALEQARA